ncbi:MAG TPA: TolC family protein [Candidatus Sumerlaeia bacterium]|nr:TolC family protein [Candidatus Sumerlaeia bacterium]
MIKKIASFLFVTVLCCLSFRLMAQGETSATLQALSDEFSYLSWTESALGLRDEPSTPIEQITVYENISLRQCLEIAIAGNFDIQNSKRDLLISQSSYREAKSEFLPSFNLGDETEYNRTRKTVNDVQEETRRERQNLALTAQQNLATGGNVKASVDTVRTKLSNSDQEITNDGAIKLNQPLLRGGGLRRGLANVRSSRLSLMDSEISDALRRRDIVLAVIEQYYGILRAKSQLRVSLDALEQKLRFLEATKIKFSLDQIAESEVSRSEIQYLQERDQVVTRRRSYEEQLEALLILLGLPLQTSISIHDITESLLQMGDVHIPELDECIAEALANRYELVQSDIAIRQREIALQTAKNETLPDLDFDVSYSAGDQGNKFRDSHDLNDHDSWNIGLSLNIPFPNIPKKEAVRRARLNLEKAEINQKSREREIIRDVTQAYRRVKASESSLVILKKTVEQAEKSLEQELGRFDAGLSTSNDVRQAQDDLFQTRTNYFGEIVNYQINIARLYKATGKNLN